jgi:hypothetical protein
MMLGQIGDVLGDERTGMQQLIFALAGNAVRLRCGFGGAGYQCGTEDENWDYGIPAPGHRPEPSPT